MDHQPYETWLLDDLYLTPEQERDLRAHLRSCSSCAALAGANLALRSAPMKVPAEGFALRFQTRLVAQRAVQRKRTIFGVFLLILASIGLLVWIGMPYVSLLSISPAVFTSDAVSEMIHLGLVLRAFSTVGDVLFNVLVTFVPVYVWALSLLFFSCTASLWVVSVHRFGKRAESAS